MNQSFPKVADGASTIIEHWLDDDASAAVLAAMRIAEILKDGIAARGVAGLAVSGGRSPIGVFHKLAGQALAWEKISITLVDERWVPAHSEDSNEYLVRQHLLQGDAASAQFIPLKTAAVSPWLALDERAAVINRMPWPLDAIVLGMGEDGHTASLFPGAEGLAEALDPTRPAMLTAIDPPHAEHPRMSLTMRALLHTRNLLLLIQNVRKRSIYQLARDGGDVIQLPIAGVLAQRHVAVEVFWSP